VVQSIAMSVPVCLSACISQKYDTIRDAILTFAQRLTWVSIIYRTKPTTKKWKIWKLVCVKTDMLRGIGKQSGKSAESVLKWRQSHIITYKKLASVLSMCLLAYLKTTRPNFTHFSTHVARDRVLVLWRQCSMLPDPTPSFADDAMSPNFSNFLPRDAMHPRYKRMHSTTSPVSASDIFIN